MMLGASVLRLLVLAVFCLHSVLTEQRRVLEQRHPFLERFRRLEEQFRRFQEVTLTRLQGIAENYNISYNIDARFHHIYDQQHALAENFNASNEVTQRELNGVKIWVKKIQKKTKNLDLKISALEEAMAERNKQVTKESKARDVAVANLTASLSSQKRIIYQLVKDKSELQKGMELFQGTIERQGKKIADLEKRLQNMQANDIFPPNSLVAAQRHLPSSLIVAPQDPPRPLIATPQIPPSSLLGAPQVPPRPSLAAPQAPPRSLIAAPEINRTPEEKLQVPPENDAGPITVKQRLLKLQAKHSQRKKLHEEQQQLISSKITMAPMAAQHGEITRKLSPPEQEMKPVYTTRATPAITSTAPPQHTHRATSQEDQPSTTFATDNKEQVSAEHDGVAGSAKPPVELTTPLLATRRPPLTTHVPEPEVRSTKAPGTICNVNSMLIFPDASTENYATFSKGLREPLLELSICSWVKTNATYLGTILSYATEENDNKLVLHGRNGGAHDALHFVIGDPAFRELPLVPLIDGNWHHTCFIWSSIQGKYWFYVDRRLTSTGSRFQKGYEIPPGGSLVLGQEQDTVGGGFDSSEAFVGSLAGFAMWNRALSPGEVSGIATGKGLPRGTVLTLSDASSIHGNVQRVDCTCLEHCS